MVCGIDTYDMITYFTGVNLHTLFVIIVVFSSIPAVRIIYVLRRNETPISDDTSLVPTKNSEHTIIIDELNTTF